MASTGVHFTYPSSSLFTFPPSNDPRTLYPPPAGSTTSAPSLQIPGWLYSGALDVKVPLTIASVYVVTVTYVNAYNRSKGNKPWPISKTKAWFWFVVAHNVFLAVYSGWTFVVMLNTLRRTIQNPNGPEGLVGTVDSLCKVHGTRGLGNAVTFNPTAASWISQSPSSNLSGGIGAPDPTDLGRLWNEGLAYMGWFFYLSKFYEVLDTAILLAKGKRSGTLQTYHHAGAMMCMWAGIRFMSPPIWMFVFVNSGIHTLMYTYYTITSFRIRVPGLLKRSLTVMQITQFLVGVSYAAAHSFVSYTIPVQVPGAASSIKNAASSASLAVSSAVASPTFANLVKKFLFRAAGEEGLAENVNAHHAAPRISSLKSTDTLQDYHTEYQTVACIDTSGQTFAVWLNVLYLAPLTYLFVRFFVKTYIIPNRSKKGITAAKAGKDAIKGVERKLRENTSANGKANGMRNGHANGIMQMGE